MTRILLPLTLLAAALAAPAAAHAQADTGGSLAPPPGSTQVHAVDAQVVLSTRRRHLLGRNVRITGRVGAGASRGVILERRDPVTGAWAAVGSATPNREGTFTATWRADRIGAVRLRGRLQGADGARSAQVGPELGVTVFRPGMASWYGPGFYGRRTACGQKMSTRLRGVAHRTLPCGTRVTLLYKGRTVTVPVVDRGPFIKGRTWDLTIATARALGVPGTVEVGALPRRR
jgi:rare lipoprotein A